MMGNIITACSYIGPTIACAMGVAYLLKWW